MSFVCSYRGGILGYLRDELPRLTFLTHKVTNAHGDMYPSLIELDKAFFQFREDLEAICPM